MPRQEGVDDQMLANMDGGATTIHCIASDQLKSAIDRARAYLLRIQQDDGHWIGELEGDTILESEYILLQAFLGREHSPLCRKIGVSILSSARPEGAWSIYPGGPVDVSASVKAYFALKLLGYDVEHPVLSRARAEILRFGGAQATNSFTRFYLALLGQMDYSDTPCVPPELVGVPRWLPFSLSAMSAWTRTIVVPLAIWSALKPVKRVGAERGIGELFRLDLPRRPSRWIRPRVSWSNFFLVIDGCLRLLDRVLPRAARRPGLRAAHRWMLEHFENSDGLGAIFPPMVSTIIALRALGYDLESAEAVWAIQKLDDLVLQDSNQAWLQPCLSPIWDTAIGMIALADSGVDPYHPALVKSAKWLVDKEVRTKGDWSVRNPDTEPTGWHFQYQNSHYPDMDDTAMVLLALGRTGMAKDEDVRGATKRSLDWLLALQNNDGGWAAYDANIDNQVLTHVPFADHNAMLDPSCADITARVIELLGNHGYTADDPPVRRALEFLWNTQEREGCWYGRWGVNYIYGSWQVLLGLRSIGFPMDDSRARRAADWLEEVQQPGGGWGESCQSYDDPSLKGIGEPTPSQTAWAILGLIAAGRVHSNAVRRGIAYLLDTQDLDGTWREDSFTGTGFPSVFYLRYHLYCHHFPLMALGRYRAASLTATSNGAVAAAVSANVRLSSNAAS